MDTKIKPALMGFDIDGVVADTMEAFIRLAREDHGVEVRPDEITDFEVEDCLTSLSRVQIGDIFKRLLDDPLAAGLQPMPNAREVLEQFAERGRVTFITARPLHGPIDAWLCQALGRKIYDNSTLVAMGEHDGKAAFIREQGLHYFVDDRAETCLNLKREGITPYVFQQPWNIGKHDLDSVESWQSIRDLCLE